MAEPSNFWDPTAYPHEEPSLQSLQRVKADIADFIRKGMQHIFISPNQSDITRINALMVGAAGTPYEDGFFQFLIKCPPTYPVNPPRVRFMTTDAGRVRFHCHLLQTGMVCLDILGTGGGIGWTPVKSLSTVLTGIYSLLGDHPYIDAFGHECRPGDAARYHTFLQHETMRVAVCDQVEAALNDRLPPTLSKIVMKYFFENYNRYEDAVTANLSLTGRQLTDPILFTQITTLQFRGLLTRLQDLKMRVEKKKNMFEDS